MTGPITTPTTLTARTPEDLLAVVRIVLGFEPAASIVMLTFGAAHAFHARVDLPDDPDDPDCLPEVAQVLLRPARGHGARSVLFVLFTDDAHRGRQTARVLRRCFAGSGITVLETLRAHGGRWFPPSGPLREIGVPYDVSAHPFVAAAVLQGRVLHDSREALAQTLVGCPDAMAAVDAALPQPDAGAAWVAATVARLAAGPTVPSDAEAARLLVAVADPQVRDAAWAGIDRPGARRHVELWSGLVRRCPDDLVPHAAGVLAFAAWLAGDGALAWCAVDRARAVDPEHSLAGLVADLLEGAVPPSQWEQRSAELGSAS